MSERRPSRRSTLASTTVSSNASPPPAPSPGGTGGSCGDDGETASEKSAERMSASRWEECTLIMECEDEPMSSIQKDCYQKDLKSFNDQMAKLESLAKQGAKVIVNASSGRATLRTTATVTSVATPVITTVSTPTPTLRAPGSVLSSGYRLLMDPRTGRILGTIGNQQPTAVSSSSSSSVTPSPVRLAAPTPPLVAATATVATKPTPRVARPTVVDLARTVTTGTPTAMAKQKEFPALCVVPKTSRVGQAGTKRAELDAKVKSLLVQTAAKFTEWLMQEGLILSEQSDDATGKLKLGMYSSKSFPNSGGYVWVSENNPANVTSVYRGSVFEASSHSPTVVLKLIYHWSCQTSVNNVMTWVKVDHKTMNFYWQLFRSVCVATVQQELVSLGGRNKVVDVGVISLGTTTSDGNKREVRVEVLGVLERSSGKVRLRATDPVAGASQAERFTKIFEPIPIWIDRASRIVTDFSIDKERLVRLGYTNVVQCSASNKRTDNSNLRIMDYLKKVVPKMFQNNLSLLSTNLIQQFLDELTFRETMGHYPLLCFDNIIQRLAVQTIAARGGSVAVKLRSIGEDAFADCRLAAPNAVRSTNNNTKDVATVTIEDE